MSTNTQTTERKLPELGQAQSVILDRVHKRAFLEKVASVAPAFLPSTEEDFEHALAIGDELQAAAAYEVQKTASVSPFAAARAALEQTLAEEGMDGNIKLANAHQNTDRLRQIGAALLQDPEIYDAALAIKIAQAQALEANG